MAAEKVVSALQSLKEERARLDQAILALEMLIAQGRRKRGRPRKYPPGPQPAATSTAPESMGPASPPGKRGRKNAPRGLLREKIREVLRKARRSVSPVDLRDAILASGYPTKSPKTLYSAVFATAKADPRVKKTASGFALR
jgi:hypothetical protein